MKVGGQEDDIVSSPVKALGQKSTASRDITEKLGFVRRRKQVQRIQNA